MIITHSHVDHFGGALGVISPREAALRKLPVIAPAGFLEESISENLMVARRWEGVPPTSSEKIWNAPQRNGRYGSGQDHGLWQHRHHPAHGDH
jgi:ribonuclease BN (tRNA processing enzyme)